MKDQSLNPQKFGRLGQEGANAVIQGIDSAKGRFEATWMAVGVVSGALAAMAIVVGHCPGDEHKTDDFNPTRRITNDTVLFCALLAASSIECMPNKAEKVEAEEGQAAYAAAQRCVFDCEAVYRAVINFESITGRKPDAFINPAMISAARVQNENKDAVVSLADLLKKPH